MKQLQKLYPHILAICGFVLIALIYFYPVLQGKKISQSDIVQYTAMAKEQNDFRASENAEPYWTNSAFGGMPTYQLGAKYPNDFIGHIDDALRFLPRPADYLFLYFLGFYGLMLVLKIDPLKAFFGALAFGFSTYLIIILGVGHNAKAHAIAYMPLVVAGVIMVFQKRFFYGGMLTMFAVALEINANHFQMTYYLLIVLIALGIYYSYKFIKNKEFKPLLNVVGTFAVALIFAIGSNATGLLATKEYADFSTRGKSDLKLQPDGTKKVSTSTLDKEYINEYSYGIAESFNLIAPRLFGGGSAEELDENSAVYDYMLKYGASEGEAKQFTSYYARTYWGEQPSVAAPAYIGAIVFFLFVLAMFHDKRKLKYVFLVGAIVSLMLSWGKNFSIITDLFIDYMPMYDKFRAVSSIQVILELCIPILAVMGLHSFFTTNKEKQWNSLWKAAGTSLLLIIFLNISKLEHLPGLLYTFSLFLLVISSFGLIFYKFFYKKTIKNLSMILQIILVFSLISIFVFSVTIGNIDFVGAMDGDLRQMLSQSQDKSFGIGFIDAVRADRRTMYSADLLRTGFFIVLAVLVLWMYTKNKMAQSTAIILVGILMVSDLFFVDKKYVSSRDFVSAREVDVPFEATTSDMQILQDTTHYRVLEVEGNLSSARASYFHKSIGGYSAVKPRAMQELFDYQIAKNNKEVIDMLNVKYIIQTNDKGEEFPTLNPDANGNAWFVNELKMVENADAEMKALEKFDSKKEVIFDKSSDIFGPYKKMPFKNQSFVKDSTASIKLTSYKPNHLKYVSNNTNNGFAVFSEMYYKNGWIATIDGKEAPILKVNYALRGLNIPAGNHKIEFKFEPQVVKTGSTIALISFIGMMLLLVGGIYLDRKNKV
ncbi:YfhO family protein [Flavobacterium chungnamense]|uniref:Membrane protein YfhO n=1 Tax=Flavobacterium chungnamense TaxID=706182 RepID=A0ABP7UPG1_9FLAO